ncbi:hypothetical protein L204_102030 [Cryptococcus depauperatus]
MAFFSDTDDSPSRNSRPSRNPSTTPSDSFLGRLRSIASPTIPNTQSQHSSSSTHKRGVKRLASEYRQGDLGEPSTTDGLSFESTQQTDIADPYAFASSSNLPSRFGMSDMLGNLGEEQRNAEDNFGMDWEQIDEEMGLEDIDDARRLGMAWTKERGTVDIMQWEGELMDTVLDKLEQQQKMVTALRSDPQTSEEEHFKLVLVQTELERVKYLVRSYLRVRLHKIERYAYHITLSPEMHNLLSGAELSHAQRYTELLHTHFQHSVLDSLPETFRRLDEAYGDGLSMIVKPNKQTPVLIYVRQDCGEIILESGDQATLAKGTTHLVRYSLIERWVNLGWVEVL